MGVVIKATALSEKEGVLSSIENSSLAASAAIQNAGLQPEQIDTLINTGVYRDSNMLEPAMAALIQKKKRASASNTELASCPRTRSTSRTVPAESSTLCKWPPPCSKRAAPATS